MGEKCIACSQWLEYVRRTKEKGIQSEEMRLLSSCYPHVNMQEYQDFLYNELAKLEVLLLREAISKFQMSVNRCLEELDLELLARAFRNLKKEMFMCFFFNGITQYPENVKKKLSMQMIESLTGFVKEFQNYVRRMESNGNDLFISDFSYICKKANLKKYVRELNMYV